MYQICKQINIKSGKKCSKLSFYVKDSFGTKSWS